jgi:hypothetical protein
VRVHPAIVLTGFRFPASWNTACAGDNWRAAPAYLRQNALDLRGGADAGRKVQLTGKVPLRMRKNGRIAMNVKVFLAIAAAIGVLYGIAFVVIPELTLATYGMAPDGSTVLAGRYFGLTLLGLGLAAWFVRETSDAKALRGLLSALAIQSAVGVLVSIFGTVNGTMNAMGWSAVLIYLVLFVGYIYYLFADRTVAGRA